MTTACSLIARRGGIQGQALRIAVISLEIVLVFIAAVRDTNKANLSTQEFQLCIYPKMFKFP